MASHLHMPVQRLQRETTSTEFMKWKRYLADSMNRPSRSDYYLAAIAAEVYRTVASKPKAVKAEDFVLKFENVVHETEVELTEESIEKYTTQSKKTWAAIIGSPKPPPKGADK